MAFRVVMHPAALDPAALLAACRETRTKRSGPGGQHRNKTETAVVLTHLPTGTTAEASERRSQAENRRMALWRLRLRLAIEHRMPPSPVGPSPLWEARSRGGRITVSPEHDDYPSLLADALDQLAAAQGDAAAAAGKGVSGGVLVKRLKPGQERRVDLPTIGPATIAAATAAGLAGIAVSAGDTIIMERETCIAAADRAGIFVIGMAPRDDA